MANELLPQEEKGMEQSQSEQITVVILQAQEMSRREGVVTGEELLLNGINSRLM